MTDNTISYQNDASENDPLHFLNQRNYGSYNRPLARIIGSAAAIFLAELIEIRSYAIERGENLISDHKHGDGWIFATFDKIEERTGLTTREQQTAVNILKRKNLIELVLIGIPARRHFKIHNKNVLEILGISKNKSSFDETPNLFYQNAKLEPAKRQTDPLEKDHCIPIKEPKEEPKEESLSNLSYGLPNLEVQEKCGECVSLFVSKIQERDDKFKLPQSRLHSWKSDFAAMHKIDRRSWEELHELIEYSQQDEFWQRRILSPALLRKHASSLIIQMKKPKSEAEKQQDREKKCNDYIEINRKYAQYLARKYKYIIERETHVEIKMKNGLYQPLGYMEDNFKDTLDKIIQKTNS